MLNSNVKQVDPLDDSQSQLTELRKILAEREARIAELEKICRDTELKALQFPGGPADSGSDEQFQVQVENDNAKGSSDRADFEAQIASLEQELNNANVLVQERDSRIVLLEQQLHETMEYMEKVEQQLQKTANPSEDKKIAALTQENTRLVMENRQLTNRIEKLKAEVRALRREREDGTPVESTQMDAVLVKQFNDILARAGQDVSAAKQDAMRKMAEGTTNFSNGWQSAEEEMNSMLTRFCQENASLRAGYLDSVQAAIQNMQSYEQKFTQMLRSVEEITQARKGMQSSLQDSIDLMADTEE